jgi:hypothetical protein
MPLPWTFPTGFRAIADHVFLHIIAVDSAVEIRGRSAAEPANPPDGSRAGMTF